jgi:hypothetical protein
MENLPIAPPTEETLRGVELAVQRLVDVASEEQTGRRAVLDWLKVEFAIEKPSLKLQDVAALNADALLTEVKKARGRKGALSVAQVKALRDEYAGSVAPLQALAAEAREAERRVADLVNAAYGLTAEEVALMWRTAPPRMPGELSAGRGG